jgi:hypothetical protein
MANQKIEQAGGKKVFSYNGFDLYVNHYKPKTARGTERIWFQIRQPAKNGKWHMNNSLAYTTGSDISFTKEK